MPNVVESSRFGTLEIADDAVIDFPAGLIGIGGRRYALLARAEDAAFQWLHAIDEPDVALPVTDPFAFFPGYEVVLSDDEAARIGIVDPARADVLVIVRAAEELEHFSVNLLAPILICDGKGHQVINEAPDTPVRAPLLSGLADKAA